MSNLILFYIKRNLLNTIITLYLFEYAKFLQIIFILFQVYTRTRSRVLARVFAIV